MSAPTESLYCLNQSMAAAASSSRPCWVAASCSGQAASDSQGKSAWTMTEGLQAASRTLGRSANCCFLCAVPPLSKGHGSACPRSANCCYLCALPPLSKGHGGGHGQDADALQETSHVPSSSNLMFSQRCLPSAYLLTLMDRQEAAHNWFCGAKESCPQVNIWPINAGSAQAEALTVLGVEVDCRLRTNHVRRCGMVPWGKPPRAGDPKLAHLLEGAQHESFSDGCLPRLLQLLQLAWRSIISSAKLLLRHTCLCGIRPCGPHELRPICLSNCRLRSSNVCRPAGAARLAQMLLQSLLGGRDGRARARVCLTLLVKWCLHTSNKVEVRRRSSSAAVTWLQQHYTSCFLQVAIVGVQLSCPISGHKNLLTTCPLAS